MKGEGNETENLEVKVALKQVVPKESRNAVAGVLRHLGAGDGGGKVNHDEAAEVQMLRGAISARAEMDNAICERLGIPPFGCDTADHLADEIEELRKDRARLSWLEGWLKENQYHYDLMLQSDFEDGVWFARFYRLEQGRIGLAIDRCEAKSNTVREAIDAAMKESQ